MTALGETLVGLAIIVALVGTVIPVLPGALLATGAVLVWAVLTGGTVAWTVGAIAIVVLVLSQILKYAIPGQRLAHHEVPGRSVLVGGALGLAGFFVVPVVGLPLGFVGGVFAAERARLGSSAQAWPSTKAAMWATGLSILIEMCAVLVMGAAWLTAALTT